VRGGWSRPPRGPGGVADPAHWPGAPIALVTFDVDGTLTREHGWAFLARRLGRWSEYEATQEAFRRGERGEDEHLLALLDLARGVPISRLFRLLERTPRLQGIGATIRRLHARGQRVGLLTHNPLWVSRWYAQRYGFDLWSGVPQGTRSGRLEPRDHLHVDKVGALRELLRREGLHPGAMAHVGDGPADARIFPRVGTGVALNASRREVWEAADLVVLTQTLSVLVPYLLRGFKVPPPGRYPRRPVPSNDLVWDRKEPY
jgi:HAD superfamily phosphoserine phosphatase-like hydrolase